MARLQVVEFTGQMMYCGVQGKRLDDSKCRLDFVPEQGIVLATPYPSLLPSKDRQREFPLSAVFWMQPMTEPEAEAAETRDLEKEAKRQAHLERQRNPPPAPKPDPVDRVAALEMQLAALKAEQAEPKLTRAPGPSVSGPDALRYVKDEKTGKIIEVKADGTREEMPVAEPFDAIAQASAE